MTRVGLALGLALPCALAGPVAAQSLSEPVPGLRGGVVDRIHVDVRPGTPVVALVLALPAGSIADPAGAEGSALVVADAVARAVEASLGPGGARATASVDLYRSHLTVLVESGRWHEAWSALDQATFGDGPSPVMLAETAARLDGALLFAEGSPAHEVAAETRALLHGAGPDAHRPPGGTRAGIAGATAASLDAFRRGQYRRTEAALAVVGDVDPARVREVLGVDLSPPPPEAPAEPDSLAPRDSVAADPPPPVQAPATPAEVPAGYHGALAWEAGDRVRIVRDVTNSWIAVAWPAPADLPPTLLDLLAHRLAEELNPVPPDPGLFDVVAEAIRIPTGPVLLVEAAVLPDATDRWEARILSALEALGHPVADEFFLWQRRRFRSAVLLREATPELAALRRVDDLLAAGEVRALRDTLWRLDPEALAAAVAALGPPRVLVFGPDLSGN